MKKAVSIMMALLLTVIGYVPKSEACTRVVYKGPNNTVLSGRTMDFSLEIPANQWIFPRGMKRNGEVGKNSIEWVSKYGTVVVSSWDIYQITRLIQGKLPKNLKHLSHSNSSAYEFPDQLKSTNH